MCNNNMQCTVVFPAADVLDATKRPERTAKLYYDAVEINCLVQIRNASLHVYLLPVLHVADIDIALTYRTGFVNANGNWCRDKTYTLKYIQSDVEPKGHLIYTWPTPAAVVAYIVNDIVTVKIEVKKLDRAISTDLILRELYMSTDASTIRSLRQELDAQRGAIVQYQQKIAEMELLIEQLVATNTMDSGTSVANTDTTNATNTATNAVNATNETGARTSYPYSVDELRKLTKQQLLAVQSNITETLSTIDQCGICLDRHINCTLAPCGHGACYDCVQRLSTCHVCRTPIKEKIRVY